MYKLTAVLTLLFVFLFSCNYQSPQEKAERERFIADSLSLEKIRTDSLSLIAFGDLKFGMTWEEVKNSRIGLEGKLTGEHYFNPFYIVQVPVNGDEFQFEGYLANDSLYRIQLKTFPSPAGNLNGLLKEKTERLSEAFTEKYGKPVYERPFPRITDLRPDGFTTVARWKIGEKTIDISISAYRHEYIIYCIIENNIYAAIAEREELKKEEEKKVTYVNPL